MSHYRRDIMTIINVETADGTTVYKVEEEKTDELLEWLEKNAIHESSALFDELIIDIEPAEGSRVSAIKKMEEKSKDNEDQSSTD
jgi:hypothetical protein